MDKLESEGIIVSCFNSTFKYDLLLEFFLLKSNSFLNLPVSVVCDLETKKCIEKRNLKIDKFIVKEKTDFNKGFRKFAISENESCSIEFFNGSRVLSYFLSPYKKTLSLDLDLVLGNKDLLKCFKSGQTLLCNNFALKENLEQDIEYVFRDLKSFWTTVMYFEKSKENDDFFNHVLFISKNWEYYCAKYNLKSNLFRNDFAFAFASQDLGRNIYNLPCSQINLGETKTFSLNSDGKVLVNNLAYSENVHCMNKFKLEEIANAETERRFNLQR